MPTERGASMSEDERVEVVARALDPKWPSCPNPVGVETAARAVLAALDAHYRAVLAPLKPDEKDYPPGWAVLSVYDEVRAYRAELARLREGLEEIADHKFGGWSAIGFEIAARGMRARARALLTREEAQGG